jgi:hypothetical protein
MRSILRGQPVYFLLLSVFFVFHGYTQNYDFIPVKDAFLLVFIYLLASVIIAAIFRVIYRNLSKAALATFYVMGFYLFFGYIYDNLYAIDPKGFFSKYSVIIAVFSFVFLVLGGFLFRYKGGMLQLNYVFNIFFLCLLLVDAGWLSAKIINRKKPLQTEFGKTFFICDSCARPDIYLIVTDNYAGDRQLKETMNFDNGAFKGKLRSLGFYTPNSTSNYNYTPFSMASMLQMEYLRNIKGQNMDHSDFSICYDNIRENHAFQFLSSYGYRLHNFSIFDIHDQPSVIESSILPERTRFITAQTLFSRVGKNILFNMANRFGSKVKMKRLFLTYHSNVNALDSLRATIQRKSNSPRFVYTHLIMPHYPYYFTENGKMRPVSEIEDGKETNIQEYLEYVEYTNNLLLNIVDSIKENSAHPPIIIIVSDHGFREYPHKVDTRYKFINQLSIYLPNGRYENFYDGISNVNLFRVLFNTQFKQKFPLLTDSTRYIRP